MQAEIEDVARQFVRYFKPTVLAQYRAESHKFKLTVSDFEGEVSLSESHSSPSDNAQRAAEHIGIRFGFRRHASGEYYLAVFAPDLAEHSRGHFERWLPYAVDPVEMSALPDLRFEGWAKRHLLGLWEVENNVLDRLYERVLVINSLTKEAFGAALFLSETNPHLHAPIAEHTHAYEDAHREAYGFLIDGLDSASIARLVKRANTMTDKTDKYTVQRLKRSFPNVTTLWDALEVVAAQRRKAAHRVRPEAQGFRAFEAFCGDLEQVLIGLSALQVELEMLFGTSGEDAMKRQRAVDSVPEVEGPPAQASSGCVSILQKAVGRTVASVTLSQRKNHRMAHRSELLQVTFTDGSALYLETGTNACNVAESHGDFPASEFDVYFHPHFVPPPTTR
jgi:hypothetical protein